MTKTPVKDSVRALLWKGDHLSLLDQRVLPGRVEHIRIKTLEAAADAIRTMVVRGAPAIGITAAYGAVLGAREAVRTAGDGWRDALLEQLPILDTARPTAINLHWATAKVRGLLNDSASSPEMLETMAVQIHEEDIAACRRMGELGAAELAGATGLMTHCNAGALATGGYGTALGVIRSAWAGGEVQRVFAGETRPWLQGARLTAWELLQDNIPVDLVAEGAAPWLMTQGMVNWVIVGADRVVANGDVANKIGTYGLALSARYHGLKFMVVAPTSTVDMSVETGAGIPIEERGADELLALGSQRVAADGAGAWNPVFDVTPAGLVDVLVTERGVVRNPDIASLSALMGSV
jgi:methylthioribose-1-phosphate isomerase